RRPRALGQLRPALIGFGMGEIDRQPGRDDMRVFAGAGRQGVNLGADQGGETAAAQVPCVGDRPIEPAEKMIRQLDEVVARALIGFDHIDGIEGAVGKGRVGMQIPAPKTTRGREGTNPHCASGCRLRSVRSSKFDGNSLGFRRRPRQNMLHQICYPGRRPKHASPALARSRPNATAMKIAAPVPYRFARPLRSNAGSAASAGVSAFPAPMMRLAAAWSPVRLTDSTTASLPLRKPKVENARVAGSPRTTHSSTPCARPAIISFRSPWSLQNQARSLYGLGLPARRAAAARP